MTGDIWTLYPRQSALCSEHIRRRKSSLLDERRLFEEEDRILYEESYSFSYSYYQDDDYSWSFSMQFGSFSFELELDNPSNYPTKYPTLEPTREQKTHTPTHTPTFGPTPFPTIEATLPPTNSPTVRAALPATNSPTVGATLPATNSPTVGVLPPETNSPTTPVIQPEIIEIIWELDADFTNVVTARANDLLLFVFTTNHDVFIMDSQNDYDTCTFNALNNMGGTSPVGYAVPLTAAGSSLFFACSVGSHCDRFGMKIQVDVESL